MTMAPFLSVKSVYKSFADNKVLDGVDLDDRPIDLVFGSELT